MNKPTPKSYVLSVDPYVPGAHKASGNIPPAVLSANENPYGCSPEVLKMGADLIASPHRYPDGGSVALRQAIGECYDLDPESIITTAGSDELIGLICRAFASEGDEVIMSQYGFLMVEISTKLCGATIVKAPEKDYCADIDALLGAVTERTKIMFLANPNNPTGSYVSKAELLRLRKELPPSVLLVMDAAYCEYVDPDLTPDYESGMAMVPEWDNIIVTRTFSKIYGLAALRLGWGYGARELIQHLERVRSPFNTSAIAQKAGVTALKDQAFIDHCRKQNLVERERLSKAFHQVGHNIGWRVQPSVTNFILLHLKSAQEADSLNQFLLEQGIIGRKVTAYALPAALRFTVGTASENDRLIEAINQYRQETS